MADRIKEIKPIVIPAKIGNKLIKSRRLCVYVNINPKSGKKYLTIKVYNGSETYGFYYVKPSMVRYWHNLLKTQQKNLRLGSSSES